MHIIRNKKKNISQDAQGCNTKHSVSTRGNMHCSRQSCFFFIHFVFNALSLLGSDPCFCLKKMNPTKRLLLIYMIVCATYNQEKIKRVRARTRSATSFRRAATGNAACWHADEMRTICSAYWEREREKGEQKKEKKRTEFDARKENMQKNHEGRIK